MAQRRDFSQGPRPSSQSHQCCQRPCGRPQDLLPRPGTVSVWSLGRACGATMSLFLPNSPAPSLSLPSGSLGSLGGQWLCWGNRSSLEGKSLGRHLSPSSLQGSRPLRYRLPPLEEAGERGPEPPDPLHHQPHQPAGSQNGHRQGDTGEAGAGGGWRPLSCGEGAARCAGVSGAGA